MFVHYGLVAKVTKHIYYSVYDQFREANFDM